MSRSARRREERQPKAGRGAVSIPGVTHSVLPLALEVSDNMDFGELIVGVGTLALAAITGLLAWKTSASVAEAKVSAEAARESADAARESAKAERYSVEAMPYIIATPEMARGRSIFSQRATTDWVRRWSCACGTSGPGRAS